MANNTNLSFPSAFCQQFFKDGKPLAGGKLYTYIAGSSTSVVTYKTISGGTEFANMNTNPIILDMSGKADLVISKDTAYKFVLFDRNDVKVDEWDNVTAGGSGGGGSSEEIVVDGTTNEINVSRNVTQGVTHYVVSLSNTIKNAILYLIGLYENVVNSLENKADKVQGATTGNLASLDADGNLTDSDYNVDDFKTKQTPKSFNGSTTKTITNLSQDANGGITSEFSDIDFESKILSIYPESFDSMTPDEREALDAKITEVTSNGGIVLLWNRGFPSVLSFQGPHEYYFTWVDVDVTFECMKYILTYDTETKLFSFTDQNIYLGNYTAGNGIGISNRVISVKCKNDGGLDKDSSGTYLKCKTNQGLGTDANGTFVKRKNDGGLDCDSNGLLVKCKTNGGLATDSNGVYLTNPLPTTTGKDKLLVIDSYGDVGWVDRIKRFYKSSFGINSLPTLTATDISNGYIDLPFDWNLDEENSYLVNFSFSLVITTASYTRNSMTLDIIGICSKIKFSVWQTGNTWFSTDSAHGSNPQGMIFNDIDASTLVSVAGYPKLETPVRVVGGNDSYTTMKGPSIRFMLNSGAQIGDKVNLSGTIFGIYHDTGF